MRNSRALAAACAAVAVLGLAAPTAFAGDVPSGTVALPGTDGGGGPGAGGGVGGVGGVGGNDGFGGNDNDGFGGDDGGFGGDGGNDGGFGGDGGNDGFGGNGNDDGFGGNGGDNGFGGNGNGGNGIGGNGGHGIPSNIVALPSVIAAGGRLTVTVDGCPEGGTMTSRAFGTVRLTPVSSANQTSRGTATVNSTARPGSYAITAGCSGRRLTRPAAFTVLGGVRGGLGGSRTGSATAADIAVGGGLVASAVGGGGLFWMRRRAERRT